MRQPPKISEASLRDCLQEHYSISPISVEFLPIGLDYQAGVYRVVSEQGEPYFLKVSSRPLYKPACLIPRYLNGQGITSVVAPLPARSGALCAKVEEWTVIVYQFIDGDTSWTGMTDEQWKEVGSVFRQIHQARLPEGIESLRKETFDPAEYVQWVHDFEDQHSQPLDEESPSKRALRATWLAYQSTIQTVITSLEKLAAVLQSQTLPYVICHADLHPANLLRDQAGRVFVIDWDEVMLAPKERDFLFVRESSADSEALPGTPAFFQGYGRTEIDWIALTYYRYERVIQDLIASAQEVFFREDLGEDTKADSVQLFKAILAEDGEIEAAFEASTHLPPDIGLPTRMISGIEKELAGRENPEE